MRIAVVADIHGNVRALRAVMDDLKQVAPDTRGQSRRLRLGPARGGRDRRRADQPRLDHDPRQSRPATARPAGGQDGPIGQGGVRRAEEPSHAWLSTLEDDREVEDLLLCHGTPDSDTSLSAGDRRAGRPRAARDAGRGQRGASAASSADRAVRAQPRAAHRRARRRPPGGQSRQRRPAGLHRHRAGASMRRRWARRTRATPCWSARKAADPWQVSFRVVAYDWDAAASAPPQKGREDWARWIRTGYAASATPRIPAKRVPDCPTNGPAPSQGHAELIPARASRIRTIAQTRALACAAA